MYYLGFSRETEPIDHCENIRYMKLTDMIIKDDK